MMDGNQAPEQTCFHDRLESIPVGWLAQIIDFAKNRFIQLIVSHYKLHEL